jgi:hypothetical protein
MNAAPISVNAAAGGNTSSGASAQAQKASTLPAFAQVMAEKQAAVSAPKESVRATPVGTKVAKSQNLPRVADKAGDSGPVNPRSLASGAAIAQKKSGASGKNANDGSGNKNPKETSAQFPAQVSAQSSAQVAAQVAAQIAEIIPGLNGAMPWLAMADLAGAVPKNVVPTNAAPGNAAPMDPVAMQAGATSAAATDMAARGVEASGLAGAQPQALATRELPGPIAADLQNLPVSSVGAPPISKTEVVTAATNSTSNSNPAPATIPADGQNETQVAAPIEIPKTANAENMPNVANIASAANVSAVVGTPQGLPTAGNDSAAPNTAVNSGSAAGSQVAATMSQSAQGDLSAVAPVILPAASAEPSTVNTQASPKIHAKRSVQEILRGAAALAGKEAQAVARVSVSVAKDFVGAIKGKSGADDNAAPITPQPAVSAKNETPVSVKPELVMPEVGQTPDKPGSAKGGSNVKGNSSVDAGSSGNSSGSAGAVGNGKDSGVSADPNAAHSGMPAVQNDPVNLAASTGNAVPAPNGIVARDPGSLTPGKTSDASNSGAAAAPDADDMAPQPNESRVVNVAQLTGSESHSQVRIAMQADQLGQVELHATVHGQLVGAAITVEKKEAHAAMAAEMPSLQQALETRQFRVGEVVLMQSVMHSTAGDAGNAATEQQRRGQAGPTYQQVENETTYEAGGGTIFEGSGIFDESGRLSVRA